MKNNILKTYIVQKGTKSLLVHRHNYICTFTIHYFVLFSSFNNVPTVYVLCTCTDLGLPCSSNGKESVCDAGNQGSIPELGSSSGEGNGNPLQYSCLEDSMDRETWQAIVRGVAKSQT